MNQLEEDQRGEAVGLSIRVGHGLHERITDLCAETDTAKSKVVRWLLEGAVDTLDEANKSTSDVRLVRGLALLHKRRDSTVKRPAKPSKAPNAGTLATVQASQRKILERLERLELSSSA